jgi:hypothetical protein
MQGGLLVGQRQRAAAVGFDAEEVRHGPFSLSRLKLTGSTGLNFQAESHIDHRGGSEAVIRPPTVTWMASAMRGGRNSLRPACAQAFSLILFALATNQAVPQKTNQILSGALSLSKSGTKNRAAPIGKTTRIRRKLRGELFVRDTDARPEVT